MCSYMVKMVFNWFRNHFKCISITTQSNRTLHTSHNFKNKIKRYLEKITALSFLFSIGKVCSRIYIYMRVKTKVKLIHSYNITPGAPTQTLFKLNRFHSNIALGFFLNSEAVLHFKKMFCLNLFCE